MFLQRWCAETDVLEFHARTMNPCVAYMSNDMAHQWRVGSGMRMPNPNLHIRSAALPARWRAVAGH